MKKLKKTLRIVLTGGPGAGKTRAINAIHSLKVPKIVMAPEAATLLYAGGFPRFQSPLSKTHAQKAIFTVQHCLEEILNTECKGHTLLFDRGTIDGAAYWPKGGNSFFKAMESSLEEELKRYDAVLFLETAAKLLKKLPKEHNHRIETSKQALELDARLYAMWSKHPNFHFIPCEKYLEDKLAKTKKAFLTIYRQI